MRFFHISDLHLGKTLNGYSLIEQQKEVLMQLIQYTSEYKVDAIFICGDIYDKTNPTNEAIALFDWFLSELHLQLPKCKIAIIAGNHDSFTKLNYGAMFMRLNNIYISPYPLDNGQILESMLVEDEFGFVKVHLACFCKPLYLGMENKPEKMNYTQMMEEILSRSTYEKNMRHILLAHQFVVEANTTPITSESEVLPLINGGLDSVDISLLNYPFNYIALGHLHRYQRVGKSNAYYSGSIYPYSTSEAFDTKGVIYGQMDQEGNVNIELLPLIASRKVRVIKDTFENIILQYANQICNDYVSIVLTQQCNDPLMHSKLIAIFPFLLEVSREVNVQGSLVTSSLDSVSLLESDPLVHLQDLARVILQQDLSKEQIEYCRQLMDGIKNETN